MSSTIDGRHYTGGDTLTLLVIQSIFTAIAWLLLIGLFKLWLKKEDKKNGKRE